MSKLEKGDTWAGLEIMVRLSAALGLANVTEMRSPKAISSARYPTRLPTHLILRKLHDGRLNRMDGCSGPW
jgi:hypothetical protein